MEQLPGKILNRIFVLLPVTEILTLNQVCKKFRKIYKNDELWREICIRRFSTKVTQKASTWIDTYFYCKSRAVYILHKYEYSEIKYFMGTYGTLELAEE
ncbi:MAG: F-box protein, partial [Planktothrix sp.]